MISERHVKNDRKMNGVKMISWYLGTTIFAFGILKVLIPTITGWYVVQMTNSGVGRYLPIWSGITGEIVTGLAFIIALFQRKKMSATTFRIILQGASATVIIMMAVAVYVHLQPTVPAEILPLEIKPPYIPVFTLLIALTNIFLVQRWARSQIEHQ